MKDPVMIDEAKFDRLSEAQEILREQKMDEAESEFQCGELDDWIIDDASKRDCVIIALTVLGWIEDNPNADHAWLRFVPNEIRDLRATRDSVIEQRADILAQE